MTSPAKSGGGLLRNFTVADMTAWKNGTGEETSSSSTEPTTTKKSRSRPAPAPVISEGTAPDPVMVDEP